VMNGHRNLEVKVNVIMRLWQRRHIYLGVNEGCAKLWKVQHAMCDDFEGKIG